MEITSNNVEDGHFLDRNGGKLRFESVDHEMEQCRLAEILCFSSALQSRENALQFLRFQTKCARVTYAANP